MILVAGVGNIFLGDDGFGPEVVRRLAADHAEVDGVRIVDYGIRGTHLAFDLLQGYDALVLVDTITPQAFGIDDPPGAVQVVQVRPADVDSATGVMASFGDAHGMEPATMLRSLDALGGALPPTYLIGCKPATLEEGIGLSAPVAAGVGEAVRITSELIAELTSPDTALQASSSERGG